MPLQITTYGNGPIITGILQGIANITTSSDYQVLLMTILGLAIVLGVYGYHKDLISLGSGAHHAWMTKAAGAFAIYWLLSAGSINVFIYDPLNTYTGLADNVPIGIAMPYYLQNQISENLSTLYGEWLAPSGYASEFSYDNPNNGAGFYNPGMASPLQAINEAMKANPPDMYFQETITGFGKDCMVPALVIGFINPNDLYTSSDIEDLISTDMPNLSPAWTTEIYSSSSPGGTTYSCSQAWSGFIKPDIDNFSGQSSGSNGSLNNVFADKFNTATNSSQNALADTLLLGNAASYMFNFSITGQQMLAQAAMMNSIGKGIMQFSESTGTSSTAQGYALTQAMSQMQSSWTTSAIIAAKLLPIFHLIMEIIVIALFPLFFALAVIPTMTGKYLKLLFELLMWLAMWSPIASILNYVVNFYMQSRVFININNPLSGTAGFNLANYNFIMQNSYIYTAVTGAMMWMIPVLSFGLVTGSAYVMSQAIGAAQGTAHGAAQQQGASTGTSSGLQGIGSQAGSLAGMQSEEKQGYNPAAAAEKIAGMGALDNLSNASAFGNNLQMNGLQNMINAKTNNMASTLGSGNAYSSPEQAYQTGMNSTFDKLAQQGITKDWAKMAGISYSEAANQLAQGKGFDVSGMYEIGKNGPIKISDSGHTHFTLNSNGQGILASATGQTTLDGQQVKTDILSDGNGVSVQTYKGEHSENISATGNMALSSIHNDTPLGQVIGNSYEGKYSEGGGKFELNGVFNRTQAQNLLNSGLIKGKAAAELQSALNSGEQSFNIAATGNKNSITGLDITNKQGATIATDGSYSNYKTSTVGSTNKNLHNTVNDFGTVDTSGIFYHSPEYSANQAFLSDGSYISNYAVYSPGGAGIVSGMKAKDTGAFGTFINQTQDMMQKYGGNTNQLVFSAKVIDELEVSGGLKLLGTGLQDKLKMSVEAEGQTMMSTNALRTETGNQLTHYADEYKNGKISWSQYQNNVNGLVSEYKNLVKIGSAPSASAFLGKQGNNGKRGVMPNGKHFMGDNGNPNSI